MLQNKKLVVIMPAYNAEKTIRQTYLELPHEYVDDVIIVDDASNDDTLQIARELSMKVMHHDMNKGYGANQKTCYREALSLGAEIIVMVHPDYQYSPRLVTAMAAMIASGHYDIVLASRILGGQAIKGGMPLYKYIANRFLSLIQNVFYRAKLSEYHTGFRAFTRNVLESIPLDKNSDDFIFDNEVLTQAIYFRFRIGEISCPTRYFKDSSSINFARSVKYGLSVIITTLKFVIQKLKLYNFPFLIRDS